MSTAEVVAIKTIDIDASDHANSHANAYEEWLKEVETLRSLKQINARNINHVIHAEPVGTVMWLITEHCAGGSVATIVSSVSVVFLTNKDYFNDR